MAGIPSRQGPRQLTFTGVGAYRLEWLRGDVVAGLTVAVMLVPQAMAYAALAGMPPITGLYAAVAPLVVYAALGTSRHLTVGPVAMTSLLTSAGLAPLTAGEPFRYMALAATLALLVGVLQALLGVLRLGFLVNFLSNSVLAGFISAAALVIGASQVGDLLGLSVPSSPTFLGTLRSLVEGLSDVSWPTLLVGLASIAVLLGGRRLVSWVPWPLVVAVVATGAAALFDLAGLGVPILGEVPSGLPSPSLPPLPGDLEVLGSLLPVAGTVALISYMEAISNARTFAQRSRQQSVDANRELVALGAANVASGLSGAFPVGGSFSRTAVNYQAGAQTRLSGVVTTGVLVLVLVLLTPLFYYLPRAVLAAIVVVAVLGLIDPGAFTRTWRIKRADGVAVAITFLATLLVGIVPGIAAGVAFSLLAFVYRSAIPSIVELGRVEGTAVFRNVQRYRTRTAPDVLILRIDGPLYYADAKFVSERITRAVASRPGLRNVVVSGSAVTSMDADGALTLRELYEQLKRAGVKLSLATLRGPVRDILGRAGLWEILVRDDAVHASLSAAVAALDLPEDSPLLPQGEERMVEPVF